ncbi:hypothetical protein BDV96DRAFT_311104 [Lophiotrema nucula]|uniref:Uncharacterized protein n=1 Tax=Lophiotrema nucula TaxID=690887 RepID=A0A6A5YKR2_9PLEO|nr:hypothetical protein BDV96DRAFT_311104 [Lophiotrema nucula]
MYHGIRALLLQAALPCADIFATKMILSVKVLFIASGLSRTMYLKSELIDQSQCVCQQSSSLPSRPCQTPLLLLPSHNPLTMTLTSGTPTMTLHRVNAPQVSGTPTTPLKSIEWSDDLIKQRSGRNSGNQQNLYECTQGNGLNWVQKCGLCHDATHGKSDYCFAG